jgi:hypothetical protein
MSVATVRLAQPNCFPAMSRPKKECPFVYAPEAVRFCPFGLRTFHAHVYAGRIPSYKFGRNRLYKIDEVVAAVERCRVATKDEVLS